MRMRIIGGIVTYNPEITLLNECVKSIASICEKILIVDNNSNNKKEISLLVSDSVLVIENKNNEGVARALNQIFLKAKDLGASWVLTLDQDTIIPSNILEEYKDILINFSNVAIVCPRVHDMISGDLWPMVCDNEDNIYVNRCITSGSINSINAWEKVGGFDDYLFIDEVDHDFCIKIIDAGYKICLAKNVIISHKIGETEIKRILGKKIYVRNHSPFRKYYICRNIIYMSKKHFGKIKIGAIIHVLAFSGKTMIWEKDKKNKLIACIRGFRDGVRS